MRQNCQKTHTVDQLLTRIHPALPLGATFFVHPSTLFFHPTLFFPPSTFLFHPLNLLFHPRTFFFTLYPFCFDPRPFLFHPPSFAWCVGWLAANQISTAFGENTGWCGFGCLVCWLLGGLPTQSKYRQHLGKLEFGCYPFFFTPLPLVDVLVGSPCLACWLLGFGENTYSDGCIMDREKNVTFWRVGLLVGLP